MTAAGPGERPSLPHRLGSTPAPALVAGLAFLLLFWEPLRTLARDWWTDSDASHGLLLGPLAAYLAWRRRLVQARQPRPVLGMVILIGAVLLRYVSGLAAELFTMRVSVLLAAAGLTVFSLGYRQLRAWWLPGALLFLSVPIPAVILNTVAFPLQLEASQIGAKLLELRNVPVAVAGNVIQLPGRSLFVTEACSGLRSLTALLALGVLIGGLWLSRPWGRALLILAAIPVALALNGIRIFLTGFLVWYVSPRLGDGFLHYTQGWVVFVVAFGVLGCVGWVISKAEDALAVSAPA